MAYGVYGDVTAMVPELLGLTYPARATLTTWLTQVSNVIDSVLASQGHSVPATDAEDISMLTHYATAKVACKAIYAATLGEWPSAVAWLRAIAPWGSRDGPKGREHSFWNAYER